MIRKSSPPSLREGGVRRASALRCTNGWACGNGRRLSVTRSACGLATGSTSVRASPPLLRNERSEEHTSELQSLMRISYAVFCLKKQKRAEEQVEVALEHTYNTEANK